MVLLGSAPIRAFCFRFAAHCFAPSVFMREGRDLSEDTSYGYYIQTPPDILEALAWTYT